MGYKKQRAAERSYPLFQAGVVDQSVAAGLVGSHRGRCRETVFLPFLGTQR